MAFVVDFDNFEFSVWILDEGWKESIFVGRFLVLIYVIWYMYVYFIFIFRKYK